MKWPLEDGKKQIDFLIDLAEQHQLNGWLLIPTDDEDVVLFAQNHELLSKYYRVTTPRWSTVRWLCDKRSLNQLAKAVSVDRPWTFCARSRAEVAEQEYPFPVILKPAMRLAFNRLTADKAWRFEDRESLLKGYDEACTLVDPELLMIQEVVPGGGDAQLSFAALCKDGIPVASLVARRMRQFPMDFGRFSTYVETIEDQCVVDAAQRLLAPTQLTGIVEIEFKKDPRSGRLKLLDVNPRVWGWHTLSIRAGVDFPYLLWRLFTGRSITEIRGRVGERWMRLCTDLPVAIEEILHGRLSLTSYLRALFGPKESAIFAWDDPLPGMLELPLLAAMMSRRLFSGKGI